MSQKALDRHNRWRSKTVAFRMSPEENAQLATAVRLCGLTKQEIRRLSKEAGLFTYDKPAYACLATRIPTGEPITAETLTRIEMAETYLSSLGLRDFRVRTQNGAAKLQVRASDLDLVLAHRKELVSELKKSYSSVVLDLEVRE